MKDLIKTANKILMGEDTDPETPGKQGDAALVRYAKQYKVPLGRRLSSTEKKKVQGRRFKGRLM